MKQITEDYCSFEIAQLLKEKGFDEYCGTAYTTTEGYPIRVMGSTYSLEKNSDYDEFHYSMPSQSLALKWLREVHDLHIIVYPWQADNEEKAIHWCCTVYRAFAHLGNDVYTNETPKSYEEAVEAALNYVLKNLI